MTKSRIMMLAAMCFAAALPARAAEGVLVVERTTTGTMVRESRIQIEPQRIRVELSEAGGTQVVVFDGAKQVMWMIDASRKTYTEMTKADVDRMAGQMSAMMAKMQEQLKNLPPQARAQMEALMKGRGGMPGMPGAASKTEFRRAGTDQVGKWVCVKYDGLQNDQKTMELCTVEPSALGFSEADFAVSRDLAEFFRGLMPQNAENLFVVGSAEQQGFSGVPVRRISMSGPQQTVTELVEVSRQTFDDSLFAVPDGFTRQAMPFGAPQGR